MIPDGRFSDEENAARYSDLAAQEHKRQGGLLRNALWFTIAGVLDLLLGWTVLPRLPILTVFVWACAGGMFFMSFSFIRWWRESRRWERGWHELEEILSDGVN